MGREWDGDGAKGGVAGGRGGGRGRGRGCVKWNGELERGERRGRRRGESDSFGYFHASVIRSLRISTPLISVPSS